MEVDEYDNGGQRGSSASSCEMEGGRTHVPLEHTLQGLQYSPLGSHLP